MKALEKSQQLVNRKGESLEGNNRKCDLGGKKVLLG